ncbi:hypothetical protein [Microbacter margulisiae]|uniref:Uncharacterized protein n=1 Tax=Microbacter margulisiae TaxID=1350067 RepID=A0A7W5DS39_9PORP|nr:hypothetical protein [Microbacter margulisiae]MBB3187770.1 hypothetical protein [Microbacter margulisiae]
MNKTILFTLIEKEISELEVLVKGMKEINTLSPTLLSLTKSKVNAILEDLDQISHLPVPETHKSVEKIDFEEAIEVQQPITTVIAEPAQKITSDESVPIQPAAMNDPHIEVVIPELPVMENVSDIKEPIHVKGTSTSLAEILNSNKQSLNDTIALQAEASLAETLQKSKVEDLRQAITLADRFRFQRELFGGNGEKFNTTLTQLNAATTKEEAMSLLHTFGWDENNTHVIAFLNLVMRKF